MSEEVDELARRRSKLSPEKRALLEKWTRSGAESLPRKAAIPRRTRKSAIPLSFAQQRLWFIDQLVPGNPAYNIPTAVRLSGTLQAALLERSINEIVRRHEALRTFFELNAGNPLQQILSDLYIPLPVVCLKMLSDQEREITLRRLASEEAGAPFVLTRAPLLRVCLLRLDDKEHVLLLTLHHSIADGWSLSIFLRELVTLYSAFSQGKPSPLPELSMQYPDFALWQRDWLRGAILEKQLIYWKQQLANAPALLKLPTDYPRPPVQSFRGAQVMFMLPSMLTAQLHARCQQQEVTLFMLLLAGFQTLLYRYAGQEDILVGSPIANRTRAEIENLIGFFANTLVLRTDLSGNPTFNELLARVRSVTLNAYAHQDIPFERLVEVLQPEREMSYTPLFQVMLTFINTPAEYLEMPDLTLHSVEVDSESALFDLRLILLEDRKGLTGILEYSTDLFAKPSMERLVAHYQVLLEQIAANSEQRIADLPILTEGERRLLLHDWCCTAASYELDICLHRHIEAQVERTPDTIALIFRDEHVTYQELDRRANQLARHLRSLDVRAETLVGVYMERSGEMVLALLATLKAGGAYLPLDPTYPVEQLTFMIEDADVSIILTQQRFLTNLSHFCKHSVQMLCLDTCWTTLERESAACFSGVTDPANLAYLIYTSGSTGKPKGVMIPHKGICNRLLWMQDAYHLDNNDRVLQKTPFNFDVSVWEFFWPLQVGASLVIAEPEGHKDSGYLVQLIEEQQITVMHFVPSMVRVFLEELDLERCHSLRKVLCSGEALSYEVQARFFALFKAELHNLYGPTEASIDVTFWACERESVLQTVPIGHPIANTRIYLLDRALHPVPIGIPGELYIGGTGLARGYRACPDLSAERFLPNPFGAAGERLYRTGDLARYLPNGAIEFLGRVDTQIKLRGFRIELSGIEATLRQHPLVEEAVVVMREDTHNEQRLVGYVVPAKNTGMDEQLSVASIPDEQVSQWELVFDEAYSQDIADQDPLFNFVGWNSSFTGEPIPQEQMLEWVEQTVMRIRTLGAQRVLEIGCGTGLLLFRLAPLCELYVGTDASAQAVHFIRKQLVRQEYQQVQVYQQRADSQLAFEPHAFDLIILNSVVQYFPSIEYCIKVLEQALRLVRPGGHIFIGDVRNLLLLEAFHSAVELHKAPESLPLQHLRQRIQRRMEQEEELLINPAFFQALRQKFSQIAVAQVQVKRGYAQNELIGFRYDVILHIEPTSVFAEEPVWLDWEKNQLTLNTLSQLLQGGSDALGITRIPNRRLQTALQMSTHLEAVKTVGELQQALQSGAKEQWVDPEDLWRMGEASGYRVEVSWSAAYADGRYDVVFCPHSSQTCNIPAPPMPTQEMPRSHSWEQYANDPLREKQAQRLFPLLNTYLKEQLPGYMLPTTLILLRSLPLLPNGKLDRKALPKPSQALPEMEHDFVAPRNQIEEQLALIWAQVLGLEHVGIYNNYFSLGGDSIRSIQIVARARRTGLGITPRHVFQHQTIIELAKAIEYDPALINEQQVMETQTLSESSEDAVAPGQNKGYAAFALAGLDLQMLHQLHTQWPDIEDIYPLSPMQEEMLTQYLREPGWGLYIVHQVFPFEGIQLDIPAFEQAWQQVIDHYPVLRTSFAWEKLERPLQIVHTHALITVEHYDLRDLPAVEQNRRMETYIQAARQKSFELTRAPQTLLALFRCADSKYQFLWMFNYMLQDGWSFPLILKEFFACYQALSQGQPALLAPPAPYRNYIAWLIQQDREKAQAFWQRMLKDLSPSPFLIKDQQWRRFSRQGNVFERQKLVLPLATTTALMALARQQQLTLNTLIQGAWALLLAHYSNRQDIVFGAIVSGRPASLPGVEGMVGFFNNILPVRARIIPEMFLIPWFKELQAQQVEARQYEYSTATAMRAAWGLSAEQCLFESYLVFENFPFDESVIRQLDAWKTGAIAALAQTEHPLRVEILPASTLWIGMSYYRHAFSPEYIVQLLHHFQALLSAIGTRPRQQLATFL